MRTAWRRRATLAGPATASTRCSARRPAYALGWRSRRPPAPGRRCRARSRGGAIGMKLSDFAVLSFDCYGTLIDWESGLLTALAALRNRSAVAMSDDQVLEAFARFESAQQRATPALPYAQVLEAVHAQLAASWGVPADAAAD